MHKDSDPDRLIDAALGTYARADSGLERRVLARIAAAHLAAPCTRWMLWAVALTAAACLLIFILLEHSKPAHPSGDNAANAPHVQQAPILVTPPAQRASGPHHAQPKNRARRPPPHNKAGTAFAARLPRQEVFPTPRPLSRQERALVNFATQAPIAARDSFVAAQQQTDAPIAIADLRIAPIQIPPLELPPPGTN